MKLLVIDIGGNSVKPAIVTDTKVSKYDKLASGRDLTPRQVVKHIRNLGLKYDRVVIGYPGIIHDNRIKNDPINLGKGWKKFDFKKAFNKPVHLFNDAALQAFGSYNGTGRMLFLGLGYGLGTAIIDDGHILPLEAGHLPFKKKTFETTVGTKALESLGKMRWQRNVHEAIEILRFCLLADEVVIGGGNSKKLDPFPSDCRKGDNDNAFTGGWKLVNGQSRRKCK